MKLRLEIELELEDQDDPAAPIEGLRQMIDRQLLDTVDDLAGVGFMGDDLPVRVETWNTRIVRLDVGPVSSLPEDPFAVILRKHGAERDKLHPSGLRGVFDSSDSLWHFYELVEGEYRETGSSSMFE